MSYNVSIKDYNENNFTLVDIRTQAEINEFYVKNSKLLALDFSNLDLAYIKDKLLSFKEDNKEILLMCRSGGRSEYLTQILLSDGVNVKNLEGGILAFLKEKPALICK